MSLFVSVAMLLYLAFQSVMDIKTMHVRTKPNNIALLINVALYGSDLIRYNEVVPTEVFVVLITIVVLYCFNIYGSGDAKALVSIYLALRYVGGNYPHPDTLLFVLSVFISSLIFTIVFKVKQLVTKRKEKRAAFFPFLSIGYVFSAILGILAY